MDSDHDRTFVPPRISASLQKTTVADILSPVRVKIIMIIMVRVRFGVRVRG